MKNLKEWQISSRTNYMKSLTDKQKEYLENGFYIERDVFDIKDMEEIFINFYDIKLFMF